MESEHYCGEWRMFDCQHEDGSVHVTPAFGREHDFDMECWCHPEPSEKCDRVIVHNVEH